MTQTPSRHPVHSPRWLALLALASLLAALAIVRAELLPATSPARPMPPLQHAAVLAALLALLAALRSPRLPAVRPAVWRTPILLGVGWLAAPAIATSLATTVSPYSRTLLFMLAPLFTAVLAPYLGSREADTPPHAWLASMAAVAGAWLVFPAALPASWPAAAGCLVLLFATIAISAANVLAAEPALPPVLPASASAALLLALASALCEHLTLPHPAELATLALLEAPPIALAFWLAPRLGPVAISARAVLTPLFAVLLGIAAMQPQLDWRQLLGLALILAGALALLARPHPAAQPSFLPNSPPAP